jgi:hypothetical protein
MATITTQVPFQSSHWKTALIAVLATALTIAVIVGVAVAIDSDGATTSSSGTATVNGETSSGAAVPQGLVRSAAPATQAISTPAAVPQGLLRSAAAESQSVVVKGLLRGATG